jgi:hypothetical protein
MDPEIIAYRGIAIYPRIIRIGRIGDKPIRIDYLAGGKLAISIAVKPHFKMQVVAGAVTGVPHCPDACPGGDRFAFPAQHRFKMLIWMKMPVNRQKLTYLRNVMPDFYEQRPRSPMSPDTVYNSICSREQGGRRGSPDKR